jgi:hypothetical protein
MNGGTMDGKRRAMLVSTAAAAAPWPAGVAAQGRGAGSSPGVLTVSGAIKRPNRGAMDPAIDALMAKHGIKFAAAHALDFATLVTLPAQTIKPTHEYDAKVHTMRGPLLVDVLKAATAEPADTSTLLLRGIDGYAGKWAVADVRKYRFLVVTHLDGKPLTVGGLGPIWATYDADRFPEKAAKPLNERYAGCPWGLYHIEVSA